MPDTIVRCHAHHPSGAQCRREAEPGSVVCDNHGGAAGQVRRRAAERVLMTADDALEVIRGFLHDEAVPYGIRLKAAQDLADRAGLAPAQIVKIMPAEEDPLTAIFSSLLSAPGVLDEPEPLVPAALEPARRQDDQGEVVQAEIVDDNDDPKPDSPIVFSSRPPSPLANGLLRRRR